MKKETNGYATNKGGMIKAPKPVSSGDPKGTVTTGKGDLRSKK